MARVVTIAGVDRTSDVLVDGFSIEQVLTSEDDNCSFKLKSGNKPATGDEIVVTENGLRLFAGIIDEVKEDHRPNNLKFFDCQARDYTYQLDQKLVVEAYDDQTADSIVRDILNKYCSGFTANHVNSGAPLVDYVVFDYGKPSECFKELADYIGWDWYVDYERDVHFFKATEVYESAPLVIDETADCRNLKHNIDTQKLRNRVYIRGGTMLSDYWTYEVKADGTARIWVLPHKPYEISLTVGGDSKTVGVENVDDESTKDYMVNTQDKYVKATSTTTTPVSGTTLSFTYKYEIDVITMVDDVSSQEAIKSVQGGDGVYEHVIVDDSLVTVEAAEAAGLADLREYANPQIKGSFETRTPGWKPGQLVDINLPSRGIAGTFLVQKVTLEADTPTTWMWKINYGGRLLGIADFLKALVSSQQNKKLNTTNTLHKFLYGDEEAKASDVLLFVSQDRPGVVENSKYGICMIGG